MSAPEEIDRYFTEQIVGGIEVIEMGPAVGTQTWSERGVWIDRLSGQAELMDMSVRSLWASDPSAALAGRPVLLDDFRRTRWGIVALGLTLWSAGLWTLFRWIEA